MYATYGSLRSEPEKTEDNVLHITSLKQKQELVKSHYLTVIDMYAEWCGPCQHIAEKYSQLADKYNRKGVCVLVKEDVELEVGKVSNEPEIYGVPTFLFYVNGVVQPELTVNTANIPMVENNINQVLSRIGNKQ